MMIRNFLLHKSINTFFVICITTGIISFSIIAINFQMVHAQSFTISAVGDWGCNSDTTGTVNNIKGKNPAAVLALGDFSYTPTAKCWLNTIKPIQKVTRINIGNHEDTEKKGLSQYMKAFALSKQYYSFDIKSVHVLAMATEISFKKGSSQFKFVENDLKKASGNTKIKWIIVTLHKPLYTSPNSCSSSSCKSSTSLINTYHHLFDRYGVDVVLQGHLHNYQRTFPVEYNSKNPTSPTVISKSKSIYNDPKGEIYVIVGTGGINFHGLKGKPSFVASQHTIRFGALTLTITNAGKTLDAKFYGNDRSVRDSFSIKK